MKIIVIGGGPAGMMAAITAAESGNQVTLIEKMTSLGKKLLITGKGRCNITSSLDMSEFIKNVPGNGRFLYSSFEQYTNKDIIQFLKKQGLEVKEERGNRIFPITDKAQDVLNCFIKKIEELNIHTILGEKVEKILVNEAENGNINLETMKIYNDYNYGSYLLFRGIPVFIDSRADLYSPEFNDGCNIFDDYMTLSSIGKYYEESFNDYGITHIILYKNSKLNMFISRDDNYKELYSDDHFIFYERLSANAESAE